MCKKTIYTLCLIVTSCCTLWGQTELQFYDVFEPLMYRSDFCDTVKNPDSTFTIQYFSNASKKKTTPFSFFGFNKDSMLVGYEFMHHPSNYSNRSVLKSAAWSPSGELKSYDLRYGDYRISLGNYEYRNEYIGKSETQIEITIPNSLGFESRTLTFNKNDIKFSEVQRNLDTVNKIYYYPDGAIKEFIQLKHIDGYDYPNGSYAYYHENGQPFIKGYFFCDTSYASQHPYAYQSSQVLRDSLWSFFNKEGQLMKVEHYHHGSGEATTTELLKSTYQKFIKRKEYKSYHLLVDFEELIGRLNP